MRSSAAGSQRGKSTLPYKATWEADAPLIQPVPMRIFRATCEICGHEYVRRGFTQKRHELSKRHQAALRNLAAKQTEEEQMPRSTEIQSELIGLIAGILLKRGATITMSGSTIKVMLEQCEFAIQVQDENRGR